MRRHRLGTHASAVAFRVLVSLVPLALLGAQVDETLRRRHSGRHG